MAATAIPVPNSGEVVATSWGAAVAGAHNGIQSGAASAVITAQNSGTVAITFPRPYSTPPLVFGTVGPLVQPWLVAVNSVTTTGAVLAVWHRDSGAQTVTVPVQWLAIGIPA